MACRMYFDEGGKYSALTHEMARVDYKPFKKKKKKTGG